MRKLITALSLSIDGFIEGPNGETDWFRPLAAALEEDALATGLSTSIDTVFYGRIAYERFGNTSWCGNGEQKAELHYNNFVHNMRKYVFSKTLKHVHGNAMVIHHNVLEEVKRLKDEDGKDILLFGGASIVRNFSDMELIDEYIFSVHPLILGSGKPLFSSIAQRLDLKLLAKEKLTSGIMLLRYKP